MSLETVTYEARKECAAYPFPSYCWAMRLMYLVFIRRVVSRCFLRRETNTHPTSRSNTRNQACSERMGNSAESEELKMAFSWA